MRKSGSLWEYVAVYVDDLSFVERDSEKFVKELENNYEYKLKGTGSISFHLRYDFFRDDDGTLRIDPREYIDKMIDGYKNMFNEKQPGNFKSTLEKGDYPELDNTELLDPSGVQKCQSMIGSIQWAVSIGRLYVATAVMSLSS